MLPPRLTFQIAAICITIFWCFAWVLSIKKSNKTIAHITHLQSGSTNRPTLASVTNTIPKLDIDEATTDPVWDILNTTLGFQKIYAISMPHRTDKRDYLTLIGLVSNLDIDIVDGVNGSEIHPKALPAVWEATQRIQRNVPNISQFWKGTEATGDYGCWRAHLNIYQHMLQNSIHTALVLEDDVDWDIFLRAQMIEFARGVRTLQNATMPLQSPYGDNWDVLALGHTGANNKPNKVQRYWVVDNDPTVIAETRRTWSRKPNLNASSLSGNYSRIVMEISKFTATTAYGISLRGAARLLYDQSLLPNANAIDMAMLALCGKDIYESPFCYGAYPMLFGRYRAIGPQDKDSDRRAISNDAKLGSGGFQESKDRLTPKSEFTVFPVSLNLGKLLRGESVVASVDPTTDLMGEVDLRNVVIPRGSEVVVGPREYVRDGS